MDGYEIGSEAVDPFDQAALASAAKRRLASMRRRPVGVEPDAMDTAGDTLGGALSGAATGAALGTAVPAVGPAIGAGVGGLIGAFQGFTKRK